MKPRIAFALNRYTQISELAASLKRMLRKSLWTLVAVCTVESAYLFFSNKPGASAFVMIVASCILTLTVWSRSGIGLPMLPLLAIQNLVIYASPIAFGHEVVATAKEAYVFQAGIEVLVFGVVLTAAWKIGMHIFAPSKPFSYVLVDVDREGLKGLSRLGFILAGIGTVYLALQSAGFVDFLIEHLPSGSSSIIVALVSGASTCGFFMIALSFGSGKMAAEKKFSFWALVVVNSLINASGFLLSAVGGNVAATAIGLFWGSGKVPWRFALAVAMMLSFLNLGKNSMRERYWPKGSDEPTVDMSLTDMPSRYSEWVQTSYRVMTKINPVPSMDSNPADQDPQGRQSLMDRIDNLQNLLFVIDAEDAGHIEPVHGDTYTLIPALLIPRILWPEKPRTHEGQVLLNVHFGRQDLNSTFTTYIAWGLLPEAYGNFGPLWGALLLGSFIGVFFAWVENMTSRKLAISLEGIVGFGLVLNMLNSFEMVASVLVSSSFQNMVPIVLAFAPFVRHRKLTRLEPGTS
jgi:hypothetical protein